MSAACAFWVFSCAAHLLLWRRFFGLWPLEKRRPAGRPEGKAGQKFLHGNFSRCSSQQLKFKRKVERSGNQKLFFFSLRMNAQQGPVKLEMNLKVLTSILIFFLLILFFQIFFPIFFRLFSWFFSDYFSRFFSDFFPEFTSIFFLNFVYTIFLHSKHSFLNVKKIWNKRSLVFDY